MQKRAWIGFLARFFVLSGHGFFTPRRDEGLISRLSR
jgi:hypothetical protein